MMILKKMGLKETKIIRTLKQKAGLGNKEILSLKSDRYIPYLPDKKERKDALRNGIRIPLNAILRVYRNRFNTRLTPEPEKKEAPDVRNILNTKTVSNSPTVAICFTQRNTRAYYKRSTKHNQQ